MNGPRSRRPDVLVYDAFLSHSSRDRRVVRRLHRRLERYQAPRGLAAAGRRLRVFHYETDAPLSPSLRQALAKRVAEIGQLVLAASPGAAASENVELEVRSYLESHAEARVHVVLVGGDVPEAYPPSLREAYADAVYADLRCGSCGLLPWLLWRRRRFRDATLPLLASLLGVDLDALRRRDRRRRRRWRTALAVVLAALLGAFATSYWRTPEDAWVHAPATEGRSVSRAVLLELPGGREVVRTLALWDEHFVSDVPDNPHAIVDDLDLTGRRTGSFHYYLDAGGEATIQAWQRGSSDLGTLAGAAREPVDVMQRPPLLLGGLDGIPCRIDKEGMIWAAGAILPVDRERLDVEAEAAGRAQGMADPSALYPPKVYELSPRRLLAAIYLYYSPDPGQDLSGTLVRVSEDRGRTWVSSRLLPGLDANLLVATTGGDGKILHLAFREDPENPDANTVLRSGDGGRTWRKVALPRPAEAHQGWLLEDLAAGRRPELLALSLVKHRSNPLQRQVLRSTDGGATWSRIEVEQPDASFLDLVGVSDGGIVAGLFHDGLVGGGDLSVVLEDGRLAFRRPTRQEQRGDLERGRLFLWRPLSSWERIQRMGL